MEELLWEMVSSTSFIWQCGEVMKVNCNEADLCEESWRIG